MTFIISSLAFVTASSWNLFAYTAFDTVAQNETKKRRSLKHIFVYALIVTILSSFVVFGMSKVYGDQFKI